MNSLVWYQHFTSVLELFHISVNDGYFRFVDYQEKIHKGELRILQAEIMWFSLNLGSERNRFYQSILRGFFV